MEHTETPKPEPQDTAQVIPLYINRPLYTDADIERAEIQEQAA
jgi:hypothetical protein